ncbi:MAG: M20/M25/M40 family metallo-hydrolase [Gammaproteobacteria bacterium]|jgi:acetylornithine deacetylase/succinyl-diaminopimelate desuccinylase-like protein|nr:M20/M25/M40 family metallo-hydrolase [Gammaproteobacteria bacterium]
MNKVKSLIFIVFALGTASIAYSQNVPLDRLIEYLEIDTINPPGNETRGVVFFQRILEEAGIDYETAESAPGRGNIWARLEGGDEPALVLLHHIDVVPATLEYWDTDPLEAVIKDGMIYARGTSDTKSLGIMHLEAFLYLHRNNIQLNRDVIFVATADEEAGGFFGAGWLIENRPEIFEGVGYLLNEGGGATLMENDQIQLQIEVAQKRPYWLRLVATDVPGHGSAPRTTSATTRLIAALNRIQQNPFEPHITATVREMFARLAPNMPARWQPAMSDIDEAILDPEFLRVLQAERPSAHALLRNTCSITILSGSEKINVVSPEASAELDCRILPDQDSAEFLNGIRDRIADDQIEIEEIMLFSPAESSTDTDLYSLMTRVIEERYSSVNIVPSAMTGFTDSHFFRDLGIVSYGFDPVVFPDGVESNIHGNNERIPLESFNQGVQLTIDVVREFVEE